MSLAGAQIGRIQDAILAAFERDELERALLVGMDVHFDQVVAPDNFAAQVFELVRWADRQERTLELIRCAHEANPRKALLTSLYADAQDWGRPAIALQPVALPGRQARCDEDTYQTLAQAQMEAVTALIAGKPDAVTRIFDALGRINEAVQACPDDARFHMLKGYALKDVYQSGTPLLSGQELREYLRLARQSAEQALRLDPGSPGVHNLLGNVLFLEQNYPAALRSYDAALRLNRDDGFRRVIEQDRELVLRALGTR